MAQARPVGRQLKVRYAFGGAAVELARTAPLEQGESVLLHGAMRLGGVGLLPRPVVLRLTLRRRRVVRIGWVSDRPEGRAALQLTRWTGRSALDRPLRDVDAVGQALITWLNAADAGH